MFAPGFSPRHALRAHDDETDEDAIRHYVLVHDIMSFRFTWLSLFIHMFEMVATPIAIIYTIKNDGEACCHLGLVWAISMLVRLPLMIPIEVALICQTIELRTFRVCTNVYKYLVLLQTVWCILGLIWALYGLIGQPLTDRQFHVWILCVSSINISLFCVSTLTFICQLVLCNQWPPLSPIAVARGRRARAIQQQQQQQQPAHQVRPNLIQFTPETTSIQFILDHKQGNCRSNTTYHVCCICMEEFNCNDAAPIVTTACNHRFHESCLRTWNESKATCPMCNASVRWPLLV